MTDDANNYLMGDAAPSISWRDAPIGHAITGTITRPPRKMQQRDIDSGKPLVWDDGTPRWQLVVNLATSLRDPALDADDGERALYVKGKSMTQALREAVRRAGAPGLEVGGTLTVTYIGDGEARNKAFSPPKLYSATYARPALTGDSGAYLSAGAAGNTHAEAQASHLATERLAQPVAAARPAPAGAAGTAVPPCPAGIDPAVWAGMDPATRSAVLATVAAGVVPPF